MRICVLLAATALLIVAVAGQASAVNWVLNPGFEDPLGSEWIFTIDSGDPVVWTCAQSTAQMHSGSYALYMAFGPTAPLGKAHVEQTITGLAPGVECTVSGWVFDVWRADRGWAYIQVLGGGPSVTSPAKGTNVIGSWQQYTLKQTADASGSLIVRLYLEKTATTTADKTVATYFDDILVEAIPEPGSLIALVSGLIGLGAVARRRR